MKAHERETKWQQKWNDEHVFESSPDDREKFFCTFPYPYVNGLPHVGHLFTIMRTEAFSRYQRLQGKNVLFPQGWHATGSPIATAAMRVQEGDEKQIGILKDLGIADGDIAQFKEPEHWIAYFVPRYKKDLQSVGLGVDWRRDFHTTSMNLQYDAFIQWQFLTLKEGGYVDQGEHPVVWCPKENTPVGDHARQSGEGETVKDFIWGKFKLKDSDLILMSGTTRPDAFFGQTHLWLDPKATYDIVEVEGEKWVVGKEAVKKIEKQYKKAHTIGEITAAELFGKWVRGPLVDYDIYIAPAEFIDASVGSGIVYSALEDPVDLAECQDLQKDAAKIEKYGLDPTVMAKLKPISIIDVPEMGDNLGADIMREFEITSAKDKKKLELAKGELNRRVFRKGVMKKNCGKYSGMKVPNAQEALKKDLVTSNDAVMFYELSGKVVCRCQTEAVVKIVTDQWFLQYGDHDWKKQVHEALNNTALYPEKSRSQFDYVVDWLNDWACTREYGLGTRLPWDEQWLIESLSDSTIYMAYYTIAHLVKDVPAEKLTREFFDWVFLGKGDKPDVPNAEEMRKEFLYWYPMDFRNSGKDLIQNHLTFMLFNHCAIFPKEHWPRGIGVNGWVTVNGQKMSKSLGNIIPVRKLVKEYGADASRITILNGGEGLDDPNWDSDFARGMLGKLDALLMLAEKAKNANGGATQVDAWLESRMNEVTRDVTAAMEKTNFRTAIQLAFFEYGQMVRWYLARVPEPNGALLQEVVSRQLVMCAPFIPHACEEGWEMLGKEGFIVNAAWPEVDEQKIDPKLDLAEQMVKDVVERVRKLKETPESIMLHLAADWKRQAYKEFDTVAKKTRHPGEILKELSKGPLGKEKDLQRLVMFMVKSRQASYIPTAKEERAWLEAALEYIVAQAGCKVTIAEAGEEGKAAAGLPGRPALSN